jgi:hypothetical protein
MVLRLLPVSLILLAFSLSAKAQSLYVHCGSNIFIPTSASNYSSMLPVQSFKVPGSNFTYTSLGGAQIGACYTQNVKPKIQLHHEFIVARYTFREHVNSTDLFAVPTGVIPYGITNYCALIGTSVQYKLQPNLSIGLGADFNVIFSSSTTLGLLTTPTSFEIYTGRVPHRLVNPCVPINLKWQPGSWYFGVKYTQALLRHHKTFGPNAEAIYYGLFHLEIGKRIFNREQRVNTN